MKNRIIAALAALAAGALLYLPAIAAAPQPRTASPTVVPAAVHRLAAAADAVTTSVLPDSASLADRPQAIRRGLARRDGPGGRGHRPGLVAVPL